MAQADTTAKPLRKPPTGVKYRQLTIQPLTEMALPFLVKRILAEHDSGIFMQSALLWEQIRRDDRAKAVLDVRMNALLGLDYAFQPPEGGEGDAGQKVAERAKTVWTKLASPADKRQVLSWSLGLGFAYGRLNWETAEDAWTPRVEVWHPCFVSWREDKMAFVVNAVEGEVTITPGKDGWWLYAPWGMRRGWAEGYIQRLPTPGLACLGAYRDWARYNEVHGLPTVKAIIPQGAEDDDEVRFVGELADRSSSPVVRLPKDANGNAYDFELVEAKADTWQAFQGMKNDANVDIAVSVLGQNLTTQVDGGSRAAATVQDKIRGDILDADARNFEEFLAEQVLQPWATFNVAGGAAPSIRFQTEEVDDLTKVGDGMTKLGAGITALKSAGVQLDVDEVTKRTDVPTTGAAEEPEPPAPVVVAPGAPPGAAGGKPPFGKPRQLVASANALPTAERTQLEGQAYADAIVASLAKEGTRHMNEDRLRILSVVHQAESLEHMRELLEKAYAEMDPAGFAEVMQVALMEAELDGLYSARGM